MKQFWIDGGNTPLYQEWWIGHWAAFLEAEGIFDDSPLKTFITSELKKLGISDSTQFARHFDIGILDFMKGTYITVDEKAETQGLSGIINTMFTSFSFPGFFPPTSSFGSHFIEGSSVRTLDVLSAVGNCLNAGFAESDITIDVILSSPVDLSRVDAKDYRSYMMLYRYLQIAYYYSAMNGLQRAKFTHPNVNYRYVVSPTVALPAAYIPMSLNATDVNEIFNQGVIDGQHAIQNAVSIDDYLEYFSMKQGGKPKTAQNFKEFVELKRGGSKKSEEGFLLN